MRFSVLSSVFLLASLAIALPIHTREEELSLRDDFEVSLDARDDGLDFMEAREDAPFEDLSLRDEFDFAAIDARDDLDLERRAKPPRLPVKNVKKQANKDARKQARKNAKAEVKAAGPHKSAQQKKANQLKTESQRKHNILSAAGREHKKTTGLPDRKHKFTVHAGGGKPEINMSGKDVRKGMFAAHVAHQHKIAANGPKMQKPAFGDKFNNLPHQVPKPGTTRPIDGMTGKGKEHTYSHSMDPAQRKLDHGSHPIRLITQPDAATGGHKFQGVIAHDQSRTGGPGHNDHFQVHHT